VTPFLDDHRRVSSSERTHGVGRIVGAQPVDERPPVRAHRALSIGQLVVSSKISGLEYGAHFTIAHPSDFTQIESERNSMFWRICRR